MKIGYKRRWKIDRNINRTFIMRVIFYIFVSISEMTYAMSEGRNPIRDHWSGFPFSLTSTIFKGVSTHATRGGN